MKTTLPPNELYAAYALFPANVPMVPYPDLPEVERKRWEFAAGVVASRLQDAFAEGRSEAAGLTSDGIVARDKAREREHRAARILTLLSGLLEEVRQAQKGIDSVVEAKRREAKHDWRLAKEAFNREVYKLIGGWS